MNLELARTFVTVVNVGSFKQAAAQLHCTQSTVTTRMRTLESLLGRSLFTRNRAGAHCTADGRRFLPHAENLLANWRQAQQSLALAEPLQGSLRLAVDSRLAADLGSSLASALLCVLPNWAVEINQLDSDHSESDADLRLGYNLAARPGQTATHLGHEVLLLVSTTARSARQWDPNYHAIDWGPLFRDAYARHYPYDQVPRLQLPASRWALQSLLTVGGAAYFPARWCLAALEQGQLHTVPDAAQFTLDVVLLSTAPEASWANEAHTAIGAAVREAL